MLQTKISIIVPVYRIPERFLRKCIESLTAQTLHDIEVILIDDGSPDNCGLICDEYAQKDGRIRVIHKENEGVSVARNAGIQEAKGQYITFVDGDDWCDERMCEMSCAFADNNNSDVVFCSARKASNLDAKIDLWPEEKRMLSEKEKSALIDAAILPRTFADGVKIAAWGKVYRTGVIRGFFEYIPNVNYGQDNVFNLSVFQSALRFSYCPDACYCYQDQNPMQTMSRFNSQKYEDVNTVIANLRKIINSNSDDISKRIQTRKIAMILMNVLPQQFFHPDNKDGFVTKYLKFRTFVKSDNLQNDLNITFDRNYFSLSQQVAVWALKYKLWFLFLLVEFKWMLQRSIGLWK